jgi:hypothetical protein
MSQSQHTPQQHRAILQQIAHKAMLDRGLLAGFTSRLWLLYSYQNDTRFTSIDTKGEHDP